MCNNGIYDHFEAHEKNCFGVVFDTMWKKKKRLQSLSFWGFCLDFGLVLRVELALFSCSKYHAHHNSQRVIEECVSIE